MHIRQSAWSHCPRYNSAPPRGSGLHTPRPPRLSRGISSDVASPLCKYQLTVLRILTRQRRGGCEARLASPTKCVQTRLATLTPSQQHDLCVGTGRHVLLDLSEDSSRAVVFGGLIREEQGGIDGCVVVGAGDCVADECGAALRRCE